VNFEEQVDMVEIMQQTTPKQFRALKVIYRYRCLVCGEQGWTRLIPVKVDPLGSDDVTNIEPRCPDCRDVEGDHRDGAEATMELF
jgi:hypothetical protein